MFETAVELESFPVDSYTRWATGRRFGVPRGCSKWQEVEGPTSPGGDSLADVSAAKRPT